MLQVQTFTVNFIDVNCYVISDETNEAIIVDCGAYAEEEKTAISNYISQNGLKICHLLCTHGHFDHIFGNQFICDTYSIHPKLHMDEADTYNHAERQMQMFLHKSFPLQIPPVEHYLQNGDCISFGNHSLRVISTPGHTPGGVCYYIESENLLLSGDSLFQGCIGRCDLPGGNEASLINNLRNKILTLPGNTKVLPGHGPSTTIDEEIRTNPFF